MEWIKASDLPDDDDYVLARYEIGDFVFMISAFVFDGKWFEADSGNEIEHTVTHWIAESDVLGANAAIEGREQTAWIDCQSGAFRQDEIDDANTWR